MYTDSGLDINVCPSTWYKKGMGKLQHSDAVLQPYGAGSDCIHVEAKFKTTITTQRGAKIDTVVYVVNSKHPIEPLMSDEVATELGFLIFRPEGRAPRKEDKEVISTEEPRKEKKEVTSTEEEKEEKAICKVAKDVKIGRGTMPDSAEVPEITEEEVEECWDIIDTPKYAEIFDPERIGKMKNREPITLTTWK